VLFRSRKLVRRKTTKKKLMRMSTKRKAHEAGLLPQVVHSDEFNDEPDIEQTNEEIEFSETDSENENGSSTDESDLEFENQLAEQVYSNLLVSCFSLS